MEALTLLQDFNSIKVQLKPIDLEPTSTPSKFQFHKGTIKTATSQLAIHLYYYFNSIKVQLKPDKWQDVAPLTKFQFHKGKIKTTANCNNAVSNGKFQFHKGTIKTA